MRRMRLGRIPTVIGIVFVALLLTLVTVIPLIDWNKHRDWVAHKVSEKIGREVRIDGKLDIKFDISPRIVAEQISVANTAWGSAPQLLRAERLEFSLHVPSLLLGRIYLPLLHLTRPDIVLEKNADGAANWEFGASKQGGQPPIIGKLEIIEGKLVYRDRAAGTDIAAVLTTIAPKTATEEPAIAVSADGKFKNAKFALKGRAGALLALRDPSRPYPFNVHGRVGGSEANVNGTITDVVRFAAMDLNLDIKGPDLAKLHDLIDIPFPPTPPYSLHARLLREGAVWRLPDLQGRIGDSDIAGRLTIDNTQPRTRLDADLVSKRLDLDDVAGFIGAPPQTGAGETASKEQKRQAARLDQKARVLPAKPYDLGKLRKIDARVHYRAHDIKAPSLPIDSMDATFTLDDGRLSFQPLKLGLAGGELTGDLDLDARGERIALVTDLMLRRVQLRKLFPKLEITHNSSGRFGGRARLHAHGNSFAQFAASADGQLGLVMNTGEISNLLLELVGLDGGEALRFFLGGDKPVPIRCAVADFEVKQGLMQTRTFVLDTEDTQITGEGSINLRDESLDLKLYPHPKDRSLFSARSPLYLRGSFKEPAVAVDKSKLARKIGAALALGALAPVAALVPLVETGEGQDSNCAALVAEVKRHTTKATGAPPPDPGGAGK